VIEESVCHIGNAFVAAVIIIMVAMIQWMISAGATTCSGTGGETAAVVVMIMVRLPLPPLLLKSTRIMTMD